MRTTTTTNTVVISREEYQTLRSAYHEYSMCLLASPVFLDPLNSTKAALCNALLAGGVTTENLEVRKFHSGPLER